MEKLVDCRAHIVIEDPNLDLYNFDGRVTIDGETLPLTTNEIVFRGSILRNTSSAIGMVLNTGEECKIRMNANKNPRTKAPEMQNIANKIVIILVVCGLATLRTILGIWKERILISATQLLPSLFLFNTLIPLSLYVSLEIIKVGQLLLMHDVEMYDPVSNTPMVSNTSTILENLGQISYVFSDKTGTLTDNIMRFRKLSVAGYAWLHDFDLVKEAAKELELDPSKGDKLKSKNKGKGITKRFSKRQAHKPRREDDGLTNTITDIPRRSGSLWKSSAQPHRVQPEFNTGEMIRYMQSKPHSIFTKKAKFFLLSIALCHTCLPEVRENGHIEFQAASPDELALVQAAQELEDELDSWLRERESDVEMPELDGAADAYRTPRTSMANGRFSFASSDIRTSIQTPHFDEFVDESLVLDDAAVFERCFQHIDDFAGEGLRTLLFGYRFLEEQDYVVWKKVYLDATTSLVDRQTLIENAGEMIEQDFDLAGATAIEDKLQKGVPETVDKLRRANIKIWMLTGDKRETAINIAHSARIAKNYSEIIILDRTTGEVEQRMATTLLDINNRNVAHSVIVVDGQTLSDIDANQTLSLLFFDLVVKADSVICCRASPSQKASLVKKIRTKDLSATTLLAVPELYTYGQRDGGFNLKKYFGWTFMAASEMIVIFFLAYGLFGESRFTDDNTLYSLGDLCFTAAVVVIVSKLLILEMHTKTYITAIGFILSIGGFGSFGTYSFPLSTASNH
ncbi:hypothetical protein DID88_000423 [Monilinia fructigena]|uniref:P-type ATPase C-terminal domain-containing protein n=1 Tax=Monilinia fructigena TaxID=38457 RepID=A0A395IIS3_9HELO|nr:hypothetical protein DID88_000423 [Monilinia fructigena]